VSNDETRPPETGARDMGDTVGGDAGAARGVAGLATTYSARQVRRARELLTALYAARRTVRFYPLDHPATNEAIRELKEVVDAYHGEGVDIALAFFEGELLLGEQVLPEESILFDQLIRELTGIGVGSLVIRRGVQAHELARMVQLVAVDSFEVEQSGGMPRMIAEAQMPYVEIGEVKVFESSDQDDNPERAQESYQDAIELMREIDTLVGHKRAISAVRVKGVVRSLVDNVLSNRQAMMALSGLKSFDEYTFYHSANVALLSLALGSSITHDYRFLSSLGTGALLHDIGKLTVDPEILNKPGSLSPEEWALMRQHPVRGAEQAVAISGLDRSAIVIVLEHHMRFDGCGYPRPPLLSRQHLASRIVAIADAFDAMTSRRAYSSARVQDEAMAILVQSAGSALDPVLTRLFLSMLGLFPPRSVVRLGDGSTAIVIRPSDSDVLRPHVRVIADPAQAMIEPYDVDLSATPDLRIVRSLDATALNIDVEDYI